MTLTVLFCADSLDPRRVAPQFAEEAASVRDHSGTVALIDHDALRRGDPAAAVRAVPRDLGPAWYRGRMITSGQYGELAAVLKERGTFLMAHPMDYQRAHELPGWHDTFDGITPPSVWRPLAPRTVPTPEELSELAGPLPRGPGIVKDYVKSRKHEWDEACFVHDVHDPRLLHAVVSRMVELQDDFLTGGVVIREYEPYAPGEVRVWWVDGEPVVVGPHPDTPDVERVPVLDGVRSAVRLLGCRFITTDLACRAGQPEAAESAWRVVEVGDGQVSDLPATIDPMDLYLHLPTPE